MAAERNTPPVRLAGLKEEMELPIFRDAGAVVFRLLTRQLASGPSMTAFTAEERIEIATVVADLQQKALLLQDRVGRVLGATDDPVALAKLLDDAYAAVTSLAVWADEAAGRLLPAVDRVRGEAPGSPGHSGEPQ